MNTQHDDPLHAWINAKLASIVADAAEPPAGHDAWKTLQSMTRLHPG